MTQMNEGFELIHDMFRLRWIPEIIGAIAADHHRYNEMSEVIEFISNTELNRKLALLQDRSAVEKRTIDGKEGYYLTEFGSDLYHIFHHFLQMSEKYIDKTEQHTLV